MYDELVKQCRDCIDCLCGECKYEHLQKPGNFVPCMNALLGEAADAIEELSKRVDESISKHDAEIIISEVAKPRWIPVTEWLPDDRRDVLIYAGVLSPYITVGYYDGLWKFSYNDEEIAGSADYWMPLPEPPKEE